MAIDDAIEVEARAARAAFEAMARAFEEVFKAAGADVPTVAAALRGSLHLHRGCVIYQHRHDGRDTQHGLEYVIRVQFGDVVLNALQIAQMQERAAEECERARKAGHDARWRR